MSIYIMSDNDVWMIYNGMNDTNNNLQPGLPLLIYKDIFNSKASVQVARMPS